MTITKVEPVTIKGIDFYIRTERYGDIDVANEVIRGDCYQLSRCPPLQTVLDIGGHIGCFSLMVAHSFPDAQVIMIEPNPRSVEIARMNLACHPNVRILEQAIDYSNDEMVLIDASQESNIRATGGCWLMPKSESDKFLDFEQGRFCIASDSVITTTIEDIIEQFSIESIDLIKWDCETAENRAIAAMTCGDKVRQMVGEYHNSPSKLLKGIDFLWGKYWVELRGTNEIGYFYGGRR